uniref:phage holin family protein n=1 Tax=Flavobacterium sp. TaxID=239 RepID=UPI0040494C65
MFIRILITAFIVLLVSNILPGVHVDNFLQSFWVAIVLILLNLLVKPILILLTIPFTIVTFGLFLLVINAIIILLCDQIVGGFRVDSFWSALWFSIILSIAQSITFKYTNQKKEKN